jgi:hypothetical protein
MKGKTSTGFKFEIPDEALDDMEVLDALIDLDAGEPSGLKTAMIGLIGADGKKALYEHCKKENGRVSVELVMNEFKQILESMPKSAKNS